MNALCSGGRPFVKMHGLGNDFVVLDARAAPLALRPDAARALADRRTGVGCDQVVVLAPPDDPAAELRMILFNADGGEIAACGNASRCVAWLRARETGAARVTLQTAAGLLRAEVAGAEAVTVDMGPARLDWEAVPLARPLDTLRLPLAVGELREPVAVGMGNPHAVFFVPDAEAVDLERLGPEVERHPLFPERVNVEAVQVLSPRRLRMRVWERGAGVTRACGTGACAAVVAAARRGLGERRAEVVLDGGVLAIDWRPDGRVWMTGPVAVSFAGTLNPDLLA